MKAATPEKSCCAHYTANYLPLTANWIYRSVINHKAYHPIFLSRTKQNINHFPLKELYSLQDLSQARRFVEILIFKLIGYIPFFKKVCLDNKIEILHVHFGYQGAKSTGLKKTLNVPLICSFYGDDAFASMHEHLYGTLFKVADKILVLGPYMKARLIELGCPSDKLVIHHLGIDVREIKFAQRNVKSGRPIRFMIASSFLEKKGIDIAIKALSTFKSKADFRLDIIGDGPLKPQILLEIEKGGIQANVTLHGYQPYAEVIRLAHQCDIFIQASRTTSDNRKEGTPMAIVDMMATGMGVISTRHSDIPEMVKDGTNGFLAEENSVESLTACIQKVFHDPSCIETFGANARAWVEQEFNVQLQTAKLERMYTEVITAARPNLG